MAVTAGGPGVGTRAGGPGLNLGLRGVRMTEGQFATPSPQWVAFGAEPPSQEGVVVALLNEPAVPIGGPIIDTPARPGKRPLTVPNGTEAPGIVLSVILNGFEAGRSVEQEHRTIERLAGMFVPGDPAPAKLIVHGEAVPHCRGAEWIRHRWYISGDPDFGEVIRGPGGRLQREFVTLTMLLVTEAEELERVRVRQPQPNFSNVVAKSGDTYAKIARRELGNQAFGGKLAQLNGDRDPNKQLAEGKRVRMPSDHLLDEWRKARKQGRL